MYSSKRPYNHDAVPSQRSRSSGSSYLSVIGAVLVAVCVFATGFFAGKIWGGQVGIEEGTPLYSLIGKRQNAEVTELDFDLFWNVWQTIQSEYVERNVSEKELFYGAIKGMVSGVDDPVTVFLTPEETQQYMEGNQGKFEGIGAELGYEGGVVVIVSPLEGSPAIESGLRSGDAVLRVDGVDVTGKSVFEVVALLRGERGTDVVITVARSGQNETMDITVTRGEITVPSITYEGTEEGIAVIDVDRFSESSIIAWESLWSSVVTSALADSPEGVVLDLRGNPGGYFNAAVYAAGEFLPEGSRVAVQTDRDGNEQTFTVSRDGKLLDIPLVVLVDGGSASASEILAGALQFHNRAQIIGERTYGKGTAQQVVDYPDGSSLHITTLKWVLPDGQWLNPENVIEPDAEVELTDEDFRNGLDPQMESARQYLSSQ
ncbi:MAG: S41 family peptidase [Candidatus Dojkabacteria bacterium]|nr:S41 family peptidase [Candidatus Dojkabacteria bacterium]